MLCPLALWVAWDGVEEKWMPISWCSSSPGHAGTANLVRDRASLCLSILTALPLPPRASSATTNVDPSSQLAGDRCPPTEAQIHALERAT